MTEVISDNAVLHAAISNFFYSSDCTKMKFQIVTKICADKYLNQEKLEEDQCSIIMMHLQNRVIELEAEVIKLKAVIELKAASCRCQQHCD